MVWHFPWGSRIAHAADALSGCGEGRETHIDRKFGRPYHSWFRPQQLLSDCLVISFALHRAAGHVVVCMSAARSGSLSWLPRPSHHRPYRTVAAIRFRLRRASALLKIKRLLLPTHPQSSQPASTPSQSPATAYPADTGTPSVNKRWNASLFASSSGEWMRCTSFKPACSSAGDSLGLMRLSADSSRPVSNTSS